MASNRAGGLPPWRRTLAGLCLLAVLSSGCGLLASKSTTSDESLDALTAELGNVARDLVEASAVPPAPKPTLRWKRCRKPFQCARLRVPLDYRRPEGPKISLALIRLPAPAGARRIGSLVINPGGPGGSGVEFVRFGGIETVPAEVRARFDIVGFDPRGVGDSQPVSCGDHPERFLSQDLDPDSAAEVEAVLAAARDLAAACDAASGELLHHVATANVVRDLDRLRAALGDAQLTYLGYSYGTLIGASYAERFPRRVRALVLDGAVDPSLDTVGRANDKAQLLEELLAKFHKACDREPQCRPDGGSSREALERLLDRLESEPLSAPMFGSQRTVGASAALSALASLLADRGAGWELLGAALKMADEGDGSLLLAVTEGSPGTDVRQSWLAPLLAVNCLDAPAPTPEDLPGHAARLQDAYPHFGALALYVSAPCAYWPVAARQQPRAASAEKAPPLVVIGTTGDGITPYSWSERLAQQLRGSVLLTRDGESHTAFGGENVCTDRTTLRYLIALQLPQPGRICG